mgnify:CR=1 FL=1
MMHCTLRRAAGIGLALFASLAGAASGADGRSAALHAQIAAAKAKLVSHLPQVADRLKAIPGLLTRLVTDDSFLDETAKPAWMTDADFWAVNQLEVRLDSGLVDQIVSGTPHAVARVRGPDDVVFVSNADHAMQPLALYVPAAYTPARPASLVVWLHGRGETENDIIAIPGLQQLADMTGTIVAAPYSRGDSGYADPASDDIYQVLDILRHAFVTDPNRVYLAGDSMGGFGVYHVGWRHPQLWSGFLSVIGGIDPADHVQLTAFRGKRVYVVSGRNDQNVGVQPSRDAVRELQLAGADVHYYEQPDAGHSMHAVFPSITKAWNDMFAARGPKPPETSTQLGPTATSAPTPQPVPTRVAPP